MGRPKKKIDRIQFEKLCQMLCTQQDIAAFFDCSISTLKRWCIEEYGENFERVYNKKGVQFKTMLRSYQLNLAKTHPAMAIFLGKQVLGQSDNPKGDARWREEFEYQKKKDAGNVYENPAQNNLLQALLGGISDDIETDDIPELFKEADNNGHVVESSEA